MIELDQLSIMSRMRNLDNVNDLKEYIAMKTGL